VRIVQGVLFGLVFQGASQSADGSGKSSTIVSTLLLVIGILMWATAIRLMFKGDDPDAPPPKWIETIGSLSPLMTFGIGALLILAGAKHWVFTLGAINVIQEAHLGQAAGIVTYLIYVIAASLLLLSPILLRIVAPMKSAAVLDVSGAWLERHNRQILIVVSVIFGSLFLVKGTAGLFA
jgi:hypothetical protein